MREFIIPSKICMVVLGFLGLDSPHRTQIMPNLFDRIDLNLCAVLIETLIVITNSTLKLTVLLTLLLPTLASHFILKGGPEPANLYPS